MQTIRMRKHLPSIHIIEVTKITLFGLLITFMVTDSFARQSSTYEDYQSKKNVAGFGLTYDHYGDDLEDWQKMYVEYRRITSGGPIIGRLNIGHRFDKTDYQGEIDYWPEFNDKWYSYFNIGVSGGDLFPEFRAGAELYRALPNGFESSLGFRYLKFSEDDVIIFTGSIGKYIGNWLLIGRPYFTPQDSGVSTSFTILGRRYLGNPDTFASLLAGFGFSPDERRFLDGQADNRFQKSRYIGVQTNYLILKQFELFGLLKLTWQEFPFTQSFTKITTFEMGGRYRF